MISVQNQLVGASIGQQVTLDCHSEAYPKSINYWFYKNNIISQGKRSLFNSKALLDVSLKLIVENFVFIHCLFLGPNR